MNIKYAILGFLSWRSLSGYDLKKLFSESSVLYWSGNNNQIYRALVELHNNGLVSKDIEVQEDRPNRKIYTITEEGLQVLREWVLNNPELPQIRNLFLVQLTWADLLKPTELDTLLVNYEDELQMQIKMKENISKRTMIPQPRTPREAILWKMIRENEIGYYRNELDWTRKLRNELARGV